jgi:hypothetical protein
MREDSAVADLRQIADELYGLAPGSFTAERNARAKDARSAGDRELATAIGHLPRPSVAAWAANLLVRERADQVEQVLALGALLRDAQEDLDPAALRSLGAQRRQVVAALGKEAGRLAAGHGQALSAAAVEELEQTLQAAMTDEAAGEALRTGRLVRSLSAEGLEVDLADAVAVPAPAAPAADARPKKGIARVDEVERKRREKAERELASARAALEEAQTAKGKAEQVRDDVEQRREKARARRDRLRDERRRLTAELAELQERLASVQERVAGVEDELEGLDEKRDSALATLDRTRHALEQAREMVRGAEERVNG